VVERPSETAPDTVATPAEPETPEAAARPKRRRGFLAALVVAIALAAAGYVGALYLRRIDPSPRIAALEAEVARLVEAQAAVGREPAPSAAEVAVQARRLADLEARVRTLEAAPPPDPSGELAATKAELERRLADLATRIDALAAVPAASEPAIEGRLNALEAAIGSGVARADVARLDRRADDLDSDIDLLRDVLDVVSERIATLEAEGKTRPLIALVVAVGQLREALRTSRPFADELASARALAEGSGHAFPEIAALEPSAGTGVATTAELAAELQDVIAAVLASAPPLDAAWYDVALGRLRDLVTIRRIGGEVEGDDPAARLARAEARLAAGDLAAAVDEVAAIGATSEVVATWLERARARAAADAAVASLGERVVAAVTADAR
jgi:hypothetical protein